MRHREGVPQRRPFLRWSIINTKDEPHAAPDVVLVYSWVERMYSETEENRFFEVTCTNDDKVLYCCPGRIADLQVRGRPRYPCHIRQLGDQHVISDTQEP
jgi:hypothetical protein